VQRMTVPAGRKAKSERLLARQRVLVCGTCGGRMSANQATGSNGQPYATYRCGSGHCSKPQSIGAELVEQFVTDHVRQALSDAQGRSSMESGHQEAEEALERTQAAYDAFTEVFDPTEPADVKRRASLKAARDEAQAKVDQIGRQMVKSLVVQLDRDWDKLTLTERQAIIRGTVERVSVRPAADYGQGVARLDIRFIGQ